MVTVQTCAVSINEGLGWMLQGLERHLVSLKEMLLLHKRLTKTQSEELYYPFYVYIQGVNFASKMFDALFLIL